MMYSMVSSSVWLNFVASDDVATRNIIRQPEPVAQLLPGSVLRHGLAVGEAICLG